MNGIQYAGRIVSSCDNAGYPHYHVLGGQWIQLEKGKRFFVPDEKDVTCILVSQIA